MGLAPGYEDTGVKKVCLSPQSQTQRLPRRSLPAEDLTTEIEMAQRRGSMDDSFHLPNSHHMAWVGPSAMASIVMMPSHRVVSGDHLHLPIFYIQLPILPPSPHILYPRIQRPTPYSRILYLYILVQRPTPSNYQAFSRNGSLLVEFFVQVQHNY